VCKYDDASTKDVKFSHFGKKGTLPELQNILDTKIVEKVFSNTQVFRDEYNAVSV
jgi:hypothetical protein